MPINLLWNDSERHILRAEFIGRWTVNELSEGTDRVAEMIRDIEGGIYIIIDGTQSNGIPVRENVLPHFKRIFGLPFEYVVIVPSSNIARMILSTMFKLNKKWDDRVAFADNLDHANTIIDDMIPVTVSSSR